MSVERSSSWLPLAALLSAPILGQTTERVSVSSSGVEGNGASHWPSISGDGRFVAFQGLASNLVTGDTNGSQDIFVRDRQNGITERVSADSGGAQANNHSHRPSISGDGRLVAFESLASNLVAGDTNLASDVFVHDRQSGATERVSLDSSGVEGNSGSEYPSISADGRFVAFPSSASNLVTGDANATWDVFIRDCGCPLASASFRNAGSNPASYTCGAPVLGANWSGTVDLSTTGHSSAYLYAFAAPISLALPQGQVLLGRGRFGRMGPAAGPLASFSFSVPNDLSLCGLHLTTQAFHLGAVSPFALSNAMDLVVGQ